MLKKLAKINVVVLAIVLTCIVFSQTGQGYISNELSLDQQSSLRAGGCGAYCKVGSTGCWNVPDCTDNSYCLEGLLVCADSTLDEYCDDAGSGTCVEDFHYACSGKRRLTGYCDHGALCEFSFYSLGSCVDAGSEWAYRCH